MRIACLSVLLVSAVPTYALRWWGLFLCLNGLFIKMYSIKLEKILSWPVGSRGGYEWECVFWT